MAKKRRKVAYQKKEQNKLSMLVVSVVVVCIVIVAACRSNILLNKLEQKEHEIALLDEKIEAQNQRALEIEEHAKEVQTKGYIEKMAREKLGLVYEGEVLYKAQQ